MNRLISLLTAGVIIFAMLTLSGCSRFSTKNDNPPLSIAAAGNYSQLS